MGRVFRARHALLGRPAAIKLLNDELATDHSYVSRFFHEAKIVNEIRNPNIIDIFDFIVLEAPRRVAYVMELLEGRSLSQMVFERQVSGTQALNGGVQLSRALEAVHKVGVVHRDLKPENIFVIAPPGSDWSAVPSLKILDFGIAKFERTHVEHRTQAGAVVGTPAYMSPEQVFGAPVSPASDVYAVGEILFEMLTGRRLFEGPNQEVFKQKVSGLDLPSVDIPGEEGASLAFLIRRCISLEPEDRPGLAEIRETLEGLLQRGAGARLGMSGTSSAVKANTPFVPTDLPSDVSGETNLPKPIVASRAPSAAKLYGSPTPAAPQVAVPEPRSTSARELVRPVIVGDRMTPLNRITPVDRPMSTPALPRPAARIAARAPKSRALPVAIGVAVTVVVAAIALPVVRGDSKAVEPMQPVDAGLVQTARLDTSKPPPAALAWVMLSTDPQGADVYEDATKLGETPINVPVEPGARRTLVLRKEGYRNESVIVDSQAPQAFRKLAPGVADPPPKPVAPNPLDVKTPETKPTEIKPTEIKPTDSKPQITKRPPSKLGGSEADNPVVETAPALPEPKPSVDAGAAKPLRKDEVTEW